MDILLSSTGKPGQLILDQLPGQIGLLLVLIDDYAFDLQVRVVIGLDFGDGFHQRIQGFAGKGVAIEGYQAFSAAISADWL